MKDDNKLEQLIRQRINAMPTAFNEAHWLNARKLIDADRRRKKRKWIFFAWALVAITSCAAFFLLLPFTPRNSIQGHVLQQPAAGSISGNGHTNENGTHPATATPGYYHVTDNAGKTTVAETAGKVNTTPDKTVANSNYTRSNARINNTIKTAQPATAISAGNTTALQPEKQHNRKAVSANVLSKTAANTAPLDQPQTGIPLNSNTQTAAPGNDADDMSTEGQAQVSTTQPAHAIYITQKHTGSLTYNWRPVPAEKVNIPAPLRPLKPKNSFITQEIGATYFNARKSLTDPVNLSAGFMYYKAIGSKAGINAGVFYSRIHQDLPARVYRNTSYDFGKNVSFVSVQTKRLDYIEFPLQVYCYPLRHHMVRAGISYLYLLQSADLVNRPGAQTHENGYVDAIRKNDMLLSAGYTWVGKSPFIFGITGYYGLYDISDNRIFGSAQNHRNTGVKLSIGYTLRQLR